MIELCAQWYAAATQALGLVPGAPVALLLSSLVAVGLTQRAKFWIRPELSESVRHRTTQAIAFVCAFVPAIIMLENLNQPLSIMWAAACGLWTPAAWRAAMVAIGWRWPDLRAALSQDERE